MAELLLLLRVFIYIESEILAGSLKNLQKYIKSKKFNLLNVFIILSSRIHITMILRNYRRLQS